MARALKHIQSCFVHVLITDSSSFILYIHAVIYHTHMTRQILLNTALETFFSSRSKHGRIITHYVHTATRSRKDVQANISMYSENIRPHLRPAK